MQDLKIEQESNFAFLQKWVHFSQFLMKRRKKKQFALEIVEVFSSLTSQL